MFWEREREDRHSEQMQAVQTQTFLFPTLPPTHIPPKVPLYSPSPLLLLLWEVKAHLPTKGLWGHASACEMWTRWHSRAALSRAVLLFTRVPVSGLTSWTKVYVSAEGKMGREVGVLSMHSPTVPKTTGKLWLLKFFNTRQPPKTLLPRAGSNCGGYFFGYVKIVFPWNWHWFKTSVGIRIDCIQIRYSTSVVNLESGTLNLVCLT